MAYVHSSMGCDRIIVYEARSYPVDECRHPNDERLGWSKLRMSTADFATPLADLKTELLKHQASRGMWELRKTKYSHLLQVESSKVDLSTGNTLLCAG